METKEELKKLFAECRVLLNEAANNCKRIPDKECEEKIAFLVTGIDSAEYKLNQPEEIIIEEEEPELEEPNN